VWTTYHLASSEIDQCPSEFEKRRDDRRSGLIDSPDDNGRNNNNNENDDRIVDNLLRRRPDTFLSSLFISRNHLTKRFLRFFFSFFPLPLTSGIFTSGWSSFSSDINTRPFLMMQGYFVSLWTVCLRQKRQYLFISSFSGVFFLFFIVL
jgi:hypothetical protein